MRRQKRLIVIWIVAGNSASHDRRSGIWSSQIDGLTLQVGLYATSRLPQVRVPLRLEENEGGFVNAEPT